MRWLGILCVVAGCTGIGIWHSIMYVKKWRNLLDCKKALCILESEISYGRTPLPEAFREMAARTGGSISVFFDTVSGKLCQGTGRMDEIWRSSLQEVMKEGEMGKEDIRELEELGNTLGYLDTGMQLRSIQLYRKRLEISLESWEGEREKRTRFYPVLGIACGVLICLLMI